MAGKYKPYPAYKPSGVEWLGDIPAAWMGVAVKQIAHIENGATPKSNEPDLWDGDVAWITPADLGKGNTPYIEYGKRNISHKGLISCGATMVPTASVILSCRAPIGTLGISLSFVSTNQGCKSLIPKSVSSEKYLYYFLSSAIESLNMLGRGSTFLELSSSDLGSFKIASPSLPEQIQIAAFLDHETAKIDALIAKQQRLIALLEEKRQAVISHAVTKGLNPNAPKRPSGIDWLGDIPAHWEVKRLGNIFMESNKRAATIEELKYPILSVSIHRGISDRELDDEELDRKISRSEDKSLYKVVSTNDLAYNMMRAWQGGFGASTLNGLVSPAYVVCTPSSLLPSKYFEFVLKTANAITELKRFSRGITDFRLRLYWDEFKDIRAPVPPVQEAIVILEAISLTIQKYDDLAAKARSAISLLKERRIALISAAVTGKIDVRDWQSQKSKSDQKLEIRETAGA